MKLTYRGVSYDYTPPQVEHSSSNSVGKYRGLDVRFRNLKKEPVLQPTLDLMYRGVAYKTNPVVEDATANVEATPAAIPAATSAPQLSVQDRARVLLMQHHRVVKRRQQAMLSRLDSEVGVETNAATRHWNHIQGKVHPSFWMTYDRSHAALS